MFEEEGSGASGGIVAGLRYFIKDCKVEPGIDLISKLVNLEEKILNSDIVITGEG